MRIALRFFAWQNENWKRDKIQVRGTRTSSAYIGVARSRGVRRGRTKDEDTR